MVASLIDLQASIFYVSIFCVPDFKLELFIRYSCIFTIKNVVPK